MLQHCNYARVLSVLWFRNFRDERGEKGLKRYYSQIDTMSLNFIIKDNYHIVIVTEGISQGAEATLCV